MSRLRIRWVLTRVALIMSVLLVVQFVSQLGLLTIRSPECEQLRVLEQSISIKGNPEKVVEKVASVQANAPLVKKPETVKQSDSANVKDSQKVAEDLKRLIVELSETRRSLVRSALHYHRIGQHIKSVNDMIKSLGGETIKPDETSPAGKSSSENSTPPKKEVCPEKFMGKSLAYGYPYFRKGFERVNCTEFVPINQLVTLLVTLPEELAAKKQLQFLKDLSQYYPSIRIVLASKEKLPDETVAKLKLNVKSIVFSDLSHGQTWSKLLHEVTTPYVLVAPDVTHFNDDVDLERLVRVLSDNKDAIIAGGSHRNLRGEWDIGCLQVTFRNWTAYFRGGYYHSFTECVVCDVLSGPFMAKTKELREVRIDENLPFGVFQDMFWRLKTSHPEKVVVSCPDVMFNTYSRKIPDKNYAALARKWNVKKWVESNGRVRWYGCRRGHSHTSSDTCSFHAGIGVPPCDLENLADAIKFVMKECEDAGLFCELQEGTLLGAVKFNKVLPWERDADITFLTGNYTAFKQLRSKFAAAGYSLSDDDDSLWCCADGRQAGGKFRVGTTRWTLELYGQHMMESEALVASGQKPTKVHFSGQWVTVMRNPGLFARNRYGPSMYRHAEHWMDTGHDSGWAFYRPSTFNQCAEPGHSACLDQYPADGNIQFSDYPLI